MYNKYCIMYNILCIYDVCRYQTDRDFDENVTSIYVVNIEPIKTKKYNLIDYY